MLLAKQLPGVASAPCKPRPCSKSTHGSRPQQGARHMAHKPLVLQAVGSSGDEGSPSSSHAAMEIHDQQPPAAAAMATSNEPNFLLVGSQQQQRVLASQEVINSARALAQQPEQQSHISVSWEQWCEHFDTQDAAAQRMQQLQSNLADAAAEEDYAHAAHIKGQIDQLSAADTVAAVTAELAAALSEERYSDAATLRDEGMLPLRGWWTCKQAQGQLMQITAEYGRWTGRVYTPGDVAVMQGLLEDEESGQLSSRRNKRSSSMGSAAPASHEHQKQLGAPLLEVFLAKQNGGTDGQQQHSWLINQAVLLRVPSAAADVQMAEKVKQAVAKAGRSKASDSTLAKLLSELKADIDVRTENAADGKSIWEAMAQTAQQQQHETADAGKSAANGDSSSTGSIGSTNSSSISMGVQQTSRRLELLLNMAEPTLAAAAAADREGGVVCADGVRRLLHRQQQQKQQQQEQGQLQSASFVQVLVEVDKTNSKVLVTARTLPHHAGITSANSAGESSSSSGSDGSSSSSTCVCWAEYEMPAGPPAVPDWSQLPSDAAVKLQLQVANALEDQRVLRDQVQQQLTASGAAAAGQGVVKWWLMKPDKSSDADSVCLVDQEEASKQGFYPDFYQQTAGAVETDTHAASDKQSEAATAAVSSSAIAAATANSSMPSPFSSDASRMSLTELWEAQETLRQLQTLGAKGRNEEITTSSSDSEASSEAAEQQQQQDQDASRSSSSGDSADTLLARRDKQDTDDSLLVETRQEDEQLIRYPARVTMTNREELTIQPDLLTVLWSEAMTSSGDNRSSSQGKAQVQELPGRGAGAARRTVYVIEAPTCSVAADQQQYTGNAGTALGSYNGVWQLAAHQLLLQHACSFSGAADRSSTSLPEFGNGKKQQRKQSGLQEQVQHCLPVTWRQPLADIMASHAAQAIQAAVGKDAASATISSRGISSASSRQTTSDSAASDRASLLVVQLPAELVNSIECSSCVTAHSTSASSSSSSSSADDARTLATPASAAAEANTNSTNTVQSIRQSSAEAKQLNSKVHVGKEGLTYRKVRTIFDPREPLEGLYVGALGSFGPQLLQLQRSICKDTGEEIIEGYKVTGDVLTPAGQLAFKVRIGQQHKQGAKGRFPPQLGVVARYPGELAAVLYEDLNRVGWVKGEFLVFDSAYGSSGAAAAAGTSRRRRRSSGWTAGAELGFMWSVAGDKKYLVLLNRVNLDS